jgi:hypothetical protein
VFIEAYVRKEESRHDGLADESEEGGSRRGEHGSVIYLSCIGVRGR